ncbi:MAG: hypothetical protein A3G34_03420 [Candidatus Lindowbacteria bacterium RIFCSPLOWO2_12_FULL_62_27]|nr:MAG: hypothetical protein A3I06_06995 [Candidatus Lindowbacteria bacterium RIFCSPLOWO2_02_FULL_62_12]OGH62994.1 MAG: hypothetical protein A3G34_03420 [Candidatus Lindowbacteria bacterium RIFCSPLOWO2_12_FULL_62_27]
MIRLSILIPVFNESRLLPELLRRLDRLTMPDTEVQLIFVDDASSDDSFSILQNAETHGLAPRFDIRIFRHDRNLGKAAAVRTALGAATGDVVVIQDADLEYDPADLPALMEPIRQGRAGVVFGSRNLTDNPRYSVLYYWGNLFLNAVVFLLYGRRISDMETGCKMMKRAILLDLDLRSDRFNIEPEITAKLLRRRVPILEVPIRYTPRSRAEGKKITAWDGLRALGTLIFWRFA